MHRIVTGLALAIGLTAASVVSVSAQQYGYNNAPSGSYLQSCNNVSMRGSTLSASCTSASGQHVYSSLNVNGCNGDIANNNGHLTCNGSYGYNNGSGYGNGYGYNRNGNDNDDEQGDHHHHHHHPNGNAYGYYGNGNHDGSGNGYGYNGNGNGYGGGYGYNLPGGSYQQSCMNARMNGSTLSATCTAANGSQTNSSLDVRRCQSRDIANRNGYLSC